MKPSCCLKKRIENIPESHRDVTLVFDETAAVKNLSYNPKLDQVDGFVDLGDGRRMNIPADEVMIAMVRSIYCKWKQPVEFWFSQKSLDSNHFKDLFSSIIFALPNLGVPLRCLSVDGLRKNWAALQGLGATTKEPWISVHGRIIFCISDMPHLIKCLRKALIKYYLQTFNGTVKKEYIDYFVRFDMTPA